MSNYKSYFLKSLGLKEDQLPGGKGDEAKPTEVSPEQLEMGIKVEMEHTNDRALAKEIALDHITEDPNYYSNLKSAGMADELPENKNGEMCSKTPMMSKLVSPTAIMPTPVIGVAVRGSSTGGLPSGALPGGGIKGDPERARLGGLEPIKNLKPNSQGAIADTPENKKIESPGGHYTPKNPELSDGGGSKDKSESDKDLMHPMQVQQIGNKPIEDDGTTRDGENTPEAAKAGVGDEGTTESGVEGDEESEEKTGVWGIPMDSEEETTDSPDEEEEEGEEVEIDIKESMQHKFKRLANVKETNERPMGRRLYRQAGYDDEQIDDESERQKADQEASDPESPKFDWKRFGGSKSPKADYKENVEMASRFKQLADIKEVGAREPIVKKFKMDAKKAGMVKADEAGALSEVKKLVAEMKAKGKTGPILERAQRYLKRKGA